jgi:hypothetical protein
LLRAFRITDPAKEKKALGRKGSNITAQNRLDLLYDMDYIPLDAYNDIKLILEIRNKYAHNDIYTDFTSLNLPGNNQAYNSLKKIQIALEGEWALEKELNLKWGYVVNSALIFLSNLEKELISGMMEEFEKFLSHSIYLNLGIVFSEHYKSFSNEFAEKEFQMKDYINSLSEYIVIRRHEFGKSIDVKANPEYFPEIFKRRGTLQEYEQLSKKASKLSKNPPESQSPSSESPSGSPDDTPPPPPSHTQP